MEKEVLNSKEIQAKAQECFNANPSLDKVHATVDGMCFEREKDAYNHTQSLKTDPEYKHIENDALSVVEAIERPASKKKAEVEGEGEKEAKAEAEAKKKAELEAKKEAEAKAKSEAEAKKKAEAEAKKQAEGEAKKQVDPAEAKTVAKKK